MLDSSKKIKVTLREVVVSSEEGKSFCDTFIYIPENIDEQALGNLYIIGEIVNFSESSSYLINTLASKIKTEFYSNPKRSTMESLESGLHKVNTALSDLAEQDNTDWMGNLNMTCSAYKNGELYISQAGKIRTVLIRDNKISDIGENIASQNGSDSLKTFANIASGELEVGDLVLFATPELFNIFSEEKLKELESSHSLDDFVQIISDVANQNNDLNTMGVLAMKIEENDQQTIPHTHIEIEPKKNDFFEKQNKAVPFSKKESDETMINKKETFNDKEAKTTDKNNIVTNAEEKLSLEDIINGYENSDEKNINTDNENKLDDINRPQAEIENNTTEEKEDSDDFLSSLDEDTKNRSLGQTLNKLSKLFIKIFLLIISPIILLLKKSIEMLKNVKNRETSDEELYQKISSVSKRKRVIVIAFILVAFILSGGLVFKRYKDIEDNKFTAYSNIFLQAQEKVDRAEIDSISDKSQARKTLLEARKIIDRRNTTLNGKSRYTDLNNNFIALLSNIRDQLDVIDLINRINDPKQVIDFNNVDHINDPEKIFQYNDKYFIFDLKNKLISDLNLSKNSIGALKVYSDENTSFTTTSELINKIGEIVFITEDNSFEIYDISTESFSNASEKLSDSNTEIKDISSYSNFIYTLNPLSNQIYKFKKTQTGFNDGNAWLDDKNINIENAISLTIDGSIYVLKSDSTIDKYRTGNKQKFSVEIPSTPISDTSTIYTKPEMNYLYITDKQNKRIVLFDKSNGKLIRQFVSDKFSNLQNIIVDQKEETIYALSGNNIFEIEINTKE
ncbi:MAG: hypothetical protein KAI71_03085 [Candidatus Pacebacteria bacterium]|nr:hypothetical protein [Candidatus Paceibacterota bacterium]